MNHLGSLKRLSINVAYSAKKKKRLSLPLIERKVLGDFAKFYEKLWTSFFLGFQCTLVHALQFEAILTDLLVTTFNSYSTSWSIYIFDKCFFSGKKNEGPVHRGACLCPARRYKITVQHNSLAQSQSAHKIPDKQLSDCIAHAPISAKIN